MRNKAEVIKYSDLTEEKVRMLGKVYWGLEERERYYHTEIEDAIDDNLEWMQEGCSFTLVAMKPVTLMAADIDVDNLLAYILESLDEEFGDPEGDDTGPTQAMRDAAEKLAEVIRREYEPWMCEEVLRVEFSAEDTQKLLEE